MTNIFTMDRKRVHNAVAAKTLPTVEILRDLNNRRFLTDTEHEFQRKIDERVRKTVEDMIVSPEGYKCVIITGEGAKNIDRESVCESLLADTGGNLTVTTLVFGTRAEAVAAICALAFIHNEYGKNFYACIDDAAEDIADAIRTHDSYQ